MNTQSFRALVVDLRDDQQYVEIRDLPVAELPAGDVTVAIAYSSLNYKDGLCVTGAGKIARAYPMVPGIDLAGTVIESGDPAYSIGNSVVLTGYGIGERHWGGFAGRARVSSQWLVPLPGPLTLRQAMAVGTAGLTAMLCVMALEDGGLAIGEREVLVTGAAGGVGSVAVALLARRGYNVTASTGRAETHAYLKRLGARQVVERAALTAPGKPLERERWAGAIDTVGGETLAGVLRGTVAGGTVAACGNAGGAALSTTVLPFILRGIRLQGVESVQCPMDRRRAAWARIARDLPGELLDSLTETIPLAAVPEAAGRIVAGGVRGRIVVDVNA